VGLSTGSAASGERKHGRQHVAPSLMTEKASFAAQKERGRDKVFGPPLELTRSLRTIRFRTRSESDRVVWEVGVAKKKTV